MSEIEFNEEKSFTHSLTPEVKVPDKGFEGWFYRKIPGGYYFKKMILFSIVALLFGTALIFVALARFNTQTNNPEFQDRTDSNSL